MHIAAWSAPSPNPLPASGEREFCGAAASALAPRSGEREGPAAKPWEGEGQRGRVAGRLFVIACTRRETATRIIFARKANARERDRYGAD
jgi:hypothetical protein